MGPECANYHKGSGLCIITKGHPHQLHRVLNVTEVKERNIYIYFLNFYLANECELKFERLGCFADYKQIPYELALTGRDSSSPVYSNDPIDWYHYESYLPRFLCECAKAAREIGQNTFGLQFYGTLYEPSLLCFPCY